MSIPYLYNASDCPIRPDEKFFITVSMSTFLKDDISPASMDNAFEAAVDASPLIPTELVTCATLAA